MDIINYITKKWGKNKCLFCKFGEFKLLKINKLNISIVCNNCGNIMLIDKKEGMQ